MLDLVFVRKEEDGSVRRLKLADLGPELAVFEGAASGIVADEDVDSTAAALEPDSAAVILVYENRWAAPLARAMRRGGGQLVVSERLPIQAILAALEATEAYEDITERSFKHARSHSWRRAHGGYGGNGDGRVQSRLSSTGRSLGGPGAAAIRSRLRRRSISRRRHSINSPSIRSRLRRKWPRSSNLRRRLQRRKT